MHKKKITIVTGTGGSLGTGHIQRMLNLAVYLNRSDSFTSSIYLTRNEFPPDEKFSGLMTDEISPDTDLIIRDMRDSSIGEMELLKKIAPVLAIDDSGEGRAFADYSLNLLPVPSEILKDVKPEFSLFLYGYNFTEGIKSLADKKSFRRDIDIAVYAGFDPSHELIESIKRSVPETADSVLLAGGKVLSLNGNCQVSEASYTEILSRTKIVVTHFGLTMFEADACGCYIAALNPTSYHNALTETVKNTFKIIYLAEYRFFSPENLKNKIQNELSSYTLTEFFSGKMLKKIDGGMENFIVYLQKICNNS